MIEDNRIGAHLLNIFGIDKIENLPFIYYVGRSSHYFSSASSVEKLDDKKEFTLQIYHLIKLKDIVN